MASRTTRQPSASWSRVANPIVSFVLLCVASAGILGSLPIVWSMASAFLTGAAAAGGIALVNTLAQVGGFVGPWAVGIIKDRTGSFAIALAALAAAALMAAVIALLLQDDERARRDAVETAKALAYAFFLATGPLRVDRRPPPKSPLPLGVPVYRCRRQAAAAEHRYSHRQDTSNERSLDGADKGRQPTFVIGRKGMI